MGPIRERVGGDYRRSGTLAQERRLDGVVEYGRKAFTPGSRNTQSANRIIGLLCQSSTRRDIPGGCSLHLDVIPAKAGIHFPLVAKQDGFPLSRE
jgi:hypothetical protein